MTDTERTTAAPPVRCNRTGGVVGRRGLACSRGVWYGASKLFWRCSHASCVPPLVRIRSREVGRRPYAHPARDASAGPSPGDAAGRQVLSASRFTRSLRRSHPDPARTRSPRGLARDAGDRFAAEAPEVLPRRLSAHDGWTALDFSHDRPPNQDFSNLCPARPAAPSAGASMGSDRSPRVRHRTLPAATAHADGGVSRNAHRITRPRSLIQGPGFRVRKMSILERVTGIEPVSPPWKGGVLPLYDTRLSAASSAAARGRVLLRDLP